MSRKNWLGGGGLLFEIGAIAWQKRLAKIWFEGTSTATWSSMLILVCCIRIYFCTRKTKETVDFVVNIFIMGGISIGEQASCTPPGYAYDKVGSWKPRREKFHSSSTCETSIGFAAGVFFRWTFFSDIFFANFSKKNLFEYFKSGCKIKF